MSEIGVDHSASPALGSRAAGQSVMRRCLDVQRSAPERGRVARALGQSPLHPDAVASFRGALGEQETGRRLAALGADWSVLHSVPLGETDPTAEPDAARGAPRDSAPEADDPLEVQHLVIGPAGVFCLRSAAVADAGRRAAVAAEARQASRMLSRTLQRVVPVTPLLVVSGPSAGAGVAAAAAAAGLAVDVVASRELARWFSRRGPVLTTAELATIRLAAEHPATWRSTDLPNDEPAPAAAFEQLKAEVDAAGDRERIVLVAAVIVAIVVALGSTTIVLDSVAPQLFAR